MTDKEYIGMVGRIRQVVVNSLAGFFRNEEDASDVVQEVMLRLWERREDVDVARVEALAVTVGRNVAISLWRKKAPMYAEDIADDSVSTRRNPLWAIEENENNQLMLEAMKQLTKTELRIFRMRQEGEMSTEDVATILNVGERTVTVALSKARRKIFEYINKKIDD